MLKNILEAMQKAELGYFDIMGLDLTNAVQKIRIMVDYSFLN